MATTYLLHFDRPLAHARHYIGWTDGPLHDRLNAHARGQGARIMAVCRERGIGWELARVWPDTDRKWERSLKRGTKNSTRLCPVCSPELRQKMNGEEKIIRPGIEYKFKGISTEIQPSFDPKCDQVSTEFRPSFDPKCDRSLRYFRVESGEIL